jgi:hypothetical protein
MGVKYIFSFLFEYKLLDNYIIDGEQEGVFRQRVIEDKLGELFAFFLAGHEGEDESSTHQPFISCPFLSSQTGSILPS